MVKTTTTLNSSKHYYEPDQLASAMMAFDEILERCQLNYFLLEETAWQVVHNYPLLKNLEEITVGIQRKDWTELSKSLVRSIKLKDLEINEDSIGFKWDNEVPITIWIINKNYEFFQRPDQVWYLYTQFRIPNPFSRYWKVRHLIK